MQLTLRIDDNNYLTYNISLSPPDGNGQDTGPEVGAASLADSKLSNLEHAQILGLTTDLIDYLESESSPAQSAPSGDWFTSEFLPNCR